MSIPIDIHLIKNEIIDFDNLIIDNYNPETILLNYTKKKITFWSKFDSIPYYFFDKDSKKDKLINQLNNNSLFEKKFKFFNFIKKNYEIQSFYYWEFFIKYFKSYKI